MKSSGASLTSYCVRYYKAEDVKREVHVEEEEAKCLGENELFETEIVTKVYADLLNGKCNVWTIQEYDGQVGLGDLDFYSRAKYDAKKVRAVYKMASN